LNEEEIGFTEIQASGNGHKVKFEKEIALVDYDNKVTIGVKDKSGMKASETIIVVYKRKTYAKEQYKNGALIIGIEDYSKVEDFPSLNFSVDDASKIAEFLESQKSKDALEDATGEGKIKINLIVDKQATTEKILRGLSDLKDCEERVYIFFSGHGKIDNNNEYLVTYNTNDYDLKSSLDMKKFSDYIKDFKAKDILIFIDACHSARAAQIDFSVNQVSGKNIVVYTSCGGDQQSMELESLGHGVFTYYILEGLEGQAEGSHKDNRIHFSELMDYVYINVESKTRGKQIPRQTGSFSRLLLSIIK